MIQMESKVHVADNTGARVAKMIGVIGTRSRSAGVGDIITLIKIRIHVGPVSSALWLVNSARRVS